MRTKSFTFWHLLFRSFLPSSASVIVGSVITFCLIAIQILLLSLRQGTLLPQLFGGASSHWANAYGQFVIDPVKAFTTNNTVNTVLLALLWGLLGWVLFLIVTAVTDTTRDVRENQAAVYVPTPENIVHHPLQRSFVMRLIWRVGIIAIAVVALVLLAPLMSNMLDYVESGMYASNLASLLLNILVVYFGWMAVLHVYTVLLRLFLFRTRVRGEIVD